MRQNTAHNFFSDTEKDRISALVAEAELHTSGEIVTMVVDESDRYREAEILGAVLLSALVALITAIVIHHITIWSYIPLVILIYLPAKAVLRYFPRLKLVFTGTMRREEAVRERAIRAFFEKGLYRTREATGVLIFISLVERKVWILGDSGINARIEADSWQRYVDALTDGIRKGRACDALCAVVESCRDLLAEHFPRRADDLNELPDEVIS